MDFLGTLKNIHPRAFLDTWLTYPRYLGTIKPGLLVSDEAEFAARMSCFGQAWFAKSISCPLADRILAISPHPDDETIGAGGFLLKHQGKAEIHFISVFDGSGGGRLQEAERQDNPSYKTRLVAARRKEFLKVATRLRTRTVQHLDLPDGAVLPNLKDAARLRELVEAVKPALVLLPWLLDRQRDHRVTNILYAWSCADLSCTVLSFEIWSLLQPNAVLDITDWLPQKLDLIHLYASQMATENYVSMAEGLAHLRAFLNPVRSDRSGAVEAFFALPNKEYCDLVQSLYGPPGQFRPAAEKLLRP